MNDVTVTYCTVHTEHCAAVPVDDVEVVVCEHGLLVVRTDRRHPVPRLGELRLDVRPRLRFQPLNLEERPPGWEGGGRSEPQVSCEQCEQMSTCATIICATTTFHAQSHLRRHGKD
jgi:hypothetical protein